MSCSSQIGEETDEYRQEFQDLTTTNEDHEILRKQLHEVIHERDILQSALESRCTEIDKLKKDVFALEKQLKAAAEAESDA